MKSILFVCTGNVCRSPLAERLLADALRDAPGAGHVVVASAGTRALVGEPMHEETRSLGEAMKVDVSDHVARTVSSGDLADASLVLTATRAHRSEVVRLYPRSVKYTLTIRQFGRILKDIASDDQSDPVEADGGDTTSPSTAPWLTDRLDAVLAAALRRRGSKYIPDPQDDDVIDPFGKSRSIHQLSARQMVPSLDLFSQTLGGRGIAPELLLSL